MSRESHLTAGVLLILMPTVVYGGASILSSRNARNTQPSNLTQLTVCKIAIRL